MSSRYHQIYVKNDNDIQSWIEAAKKEFFEHKKEKNEEEKLLYDDDEVDKYISETRFRKSPWVRLYVYGDSWYDKRWGVIQGGDQMTPVLMRGSRVRCISKHSTWTGRKLGHELPTGWCIAIFQRYIRMKRITAFTPQQFREQTEWAVKKIKNRWNTTKSFDDKDNRLCPSYRYREHKNMYYYDVLIKGRQFTLTEHQYKYLTKLRSIVEKFKTVDKRRHALMG